MKNDESRLQQALMTWWDYIHGSLGCSRAVLFAIPNGGFRNIATASRLKREGVRAGMPDLMLCIGTDKHHGLFLELKAGKAGKVSPVQKAVHVALMEEGYKVEVVRTLDQAIEVITQHIEDHFSD